MKASPTPPSAPHRRPSRTPFGRSLLRLGRLLAPAFLLLAVDCSREEPDTGGETHFLRLCAPNGSSCGENLACRCGVCSRACADDSACSAYPNAVCREPGTSTAELCSAAELTPICEVPCEGDGDCATLSRAHVCRAGVCRLEAPSPGGDGAPGCEDPPVRADRVVLLGDSFLATTGETTAHLAELSRAAGFLAMDASYRDHARLTDNALALLGEGILAEYEEARAGGPVELAIVQGGGADVLLGTCAVVNASCPLLVDAAAALGSLFERLAADGVRSVLLLGYPNALDETVRRRMDALRPLLAEVCATAPLPCVAIDLRETFADRYDEYVSADGLNPTTAGSEATAGVLWATMRRECLAP